MSNPNKSGRRYTYEITIKRIDHDRHNTDVETREFPNYREWKIDFEDGAKFSFTRPIKDKK